MAKQDLMTIFEKNRYDRNIVNKSKEWYFQRTWLLARKRVNRDKLFSQEKLTSRIEPGKLYMFYYDPKWKDKLPYYDTFPLVFPFTALDNGFLGLNMHYLPYYDRVQLLSRLMTISGNRKLDANTKLKYSWGLISGVSKFKTAAPCVKHYLLDHVQSQFIEIPSTDWHTAMMLPVEKFVKSSKVNVWADSWQKIS